MSQCLGDDGDVNIGVVGDASPRMACHIRCQRLSQTNHPAHLLQLQTYLSIICRIGSAAQLTVDGIFFGTEAEFKAAQTEAPVVYGDKEIALGTWGWGWNSKVEFADGIMTGTLTGDNGAIYNLAGQRVNENYKGIVISSSTNNHK